MVLDHNTFRQQASEGELHIKFSIRDNEDFYTESSDLESYEIVFFPWWRLNGDENIHGEVVDYGESITNGNIIIKNGEITHLSSNHCDREYSLLTKPILAYASATVMKHLGRYTTT